jgi:hypothetical protein
LACNRGLPHDPGIGVLKGGLNARRSVAISEMLETRLQIATFSRDIAYAVSRRGGGHLPDDAKLLSPPR